jgi:hypothetical protein
MFSKSSIPPLVPTKTPIQWVAASFHGEKAVEAECRQLYVILAPRLTMNTAVNPLPLYAHRAWAETECRGA